MIIEHHAADTYWCPFARKFMGDTEIGAAAANRDGRDQPHETSPCLGSDCMAWRWVMIDGPCGDDIPSQKRGYCGLAGTVRA